MAPRKQAGAPPVPTRRSSRIRSKQIAKAGEVAVEPTTTKTTAEKKRLSKIAEKKPAVKSETTSVESLPSRLSDTDAKRAKTTKAITTAQRITRLGHYIVKRFGSRDVDFRFYIGGFFIGQYCPKFHRQWSRECFLYDSFTFEEVALAYKHLHKPSKMRPNLSLKKRQTDHWECLCNFALECRVILEKHNMPTRQKPYCYELYYHQDTLATRYSKFVSVVSKTTPLRSSIFQPFAFPGVRYGPYLIETDSQSVSASFEIDLQRAIDEIGHEWLCRDLPSDSEDSAKLEDFGGSKDSEYARDLQLSEHPASEASSEDSCVDLDEGSEPHHLRTINRYGDILTSYYPSLSAAYRLDVDMVKKVFAFRPIDTLPNCLHDIGPLYLDADLECFDQAVKRAEFFNETVPIQFDVEGVEWTLESEDPRTELATEVRRMIRETLDLDESGMSLELYNEHLVHDNYVFYRSRFPTLLPDIGPFSLRDTGEQVENKIRQQLSAHCWEVARMITYSVHGIQDWKKHYYLKWTMEFQPYYQRLGLEYPHTIRDLNKSLTRKLPFGTKSPMSNLLDRRLRAFTQSKSNVFKHVKSMMVHAAFGQFGLDLTDYDLDFPENKLLVTPRDDCPLAPDVGGFGDIKGIAVELPKRLMNEMFDADGQVKKDGPEARALETNSIAITSAILRKCGLDLGVANRWILEVSPYYFIWRPKSLARTKPPRNLGPFYWGTSQWHICRAYEMGYHYGLNGILKNVNDVPEELRDYDYPQLRRYYEICDHDKSLTSSAMPASSPQPRPLSTSRPNSLPSLNSRRSSTMSSPKTPKSGGVVYNVYKTPTVEDVPEEDYIPFPKSSTSSLFPVSPPVRVVKRRASNLENTEAKTALPSKDASHEAKTSYSENANSRPQMETGPPFQGEPSIFFPQLANLQWPPYFPMAPGIPLQGVPFTLAPGLSPSHPSDTTFTTNSLRELTSSTENSLGLHELRDINRHLSYLIDNERDASEYSSCFARLMDFKVTRQLLLETGIGQTVGELRDHSKHGLAIPAKTLIRKWKKDLKEERRASRAASNASGALSNASRGHIGDVTGDSHIPGMISSSMETPHVDTGSNYKPGGADLSQTTPLSSASLPATPYNSIQPSEASTLYSPTYPPYFASTPTYPAMNAGFPVPMPMYSPTGPAGYAVPHTWYTQGYQMPGYSGVSRYTHGGSSSSWPTDSFTSTGHTATGPGSSTTGPSMPFAMPSPFVVPGTQPSPTGYIPMTPAQYVPMGPPPLPHFFSNAPTTPLSTSQDTSKSGPVRETPANPPTFNPSVTMTQASGPQILKIGNPRAKWFQTKDSPTDTKKVRFSPRHQGPSGSFFQEKIGDPVKKLHTQADEAEEEEEERDHSSDYVWGQGPEFEVLDYRAYDEDLDSYSVDQEEGGES